MKGRASLWKSTGTRTSTKQQQRLTEPTSEPPASPHSHPLPNPERGVHSSFFATLPMPHDDHRRPSSAMRKIKREQRVPRKAPLWLFYLFLNKTKAWVCQNPTSLQAPQVTSRQRHGVSPTMLYGGTPDPDTLLEMDVVVYKQSPDSKKQLGCVQEDGRITPLSAWTLEPAFAESLEFVVDEHDLFPGLQVANIEIVEIVPSDKLSYGSRQVGGGKGPGNPHGEESELLYYIDQDILSDVEIVVKPELEILW